MVTHIVILLEIINASFIYLCGSFNHMSSVTKVMNAREMMNQKGLIK